MADVSPCNLGWQWDHWRVRSSFAGFPKVDLPARPELESKIWHIRVGSKHGIAHIIGTLI